ncbi:MAG: ribosome small subunit-dependent GTPase A [Flavobacteriales bacterium]|nr:ribosome small subunit-dependent GTPase A [Flavobacteriales bacterium]
MSKGLVYKSTGSFYKVKIGNTFEECVLAGKYRLEGKRTTNPVAVGDWVELNTEKLPPVIETISPRKNYIIRKSVNLSKEAHILASNIDLVLIVASVAKPRTSTGFINRILVTAEAYGIPAAVVFNKADLQNAKETAATAELAEEFDFLGYTSFITDALSHQGVDALRTFLEDKTLLVIGHSGVGKSSLLNALDPMLNVKTGGISKKHNKGMHTTTFAEMHDTSFGARIIDTPGVKEFGLVDIQPADVSGYFPEIRELRKKCRFHNCLHLEEPGCAVKEALETGEIAAFRFQDYLNILETIFPK